VSRPANSSPSRAADALAPLSSGYRAIFENARRVCESDERVRALWLSGSLARGAADAASDLDLLIAVRDADLADFATGWREFLGRITPTLIARPLPFLPGSFYSVAPGRERIDLVVEPVSRLAQSFFRTRRVVIDKDDLDAQVPAAAPGAPPSAERLAFLVEEFFRDYGMFDVGATRGDRLLGNEATHFLRGLLYQLFCEANAPLPATGVKQWSAKLSAAQREVLEALPTGGKSWGEIVAAHEAVACAFVTHAREILAAHGVSWPSELEHATRSHLRAHGLPALD
jgi:hypothetical protein